MVKFSDYRLQEILEKAANNVLNDIETTEISSIDLFKIIEYIINRG